MKNKQLFFFATLSDITPVLTSIDLTFSVKYYETGLFDEKKRDYYTSALSLPDLGVTTHGDWNTTRSFLVIPAEVDLNLRAVSQRAGGVKYAVDQLVNPNSVVISLGGKYLKKSDVIVAGKVSTVSDTLFSQDYIKTIGLNMKKFKKIDGFYVGSESEANLRRGWRLVLDEGRRKEYDLVAK